MCLKPDLHVGFAGQQNTQPTRSSPGPPDTQQFTEVKTIKAWGQGQVEMRGTHLRHNTSGGQNFRSQDK